MKNKLVIALVVETILVVMFFLYALVQRTQAIAAQKRAEENLIMAEQNEHRAINAQEHAEQSQLEVMRQATVATEQAALAQKASQDCLSKKK
jgi:hypothetical protein